MNKLLPAILAASAMVHSPLPLDREHSLDAEADAKPVLAEQTLRGAWHADGRGSLTACGDTAATLVVDFRTAGQRARGSSDDPDYALYGRATATLSLGGLPLDRYNRLMLEIEPECPGMRVVNVNLSFENGAGAVGEGFNPPTGSHLVNLENYRRNRCYLEIADFRRDAMKGLSLSVSVNGRDLTTADSAVFHVRRVVAQRVARTEQVSGWQPAEGHIAYSMSGYAADGAKTAIVGADAALKARNFRITSEPDGRTIYSGKIAARQTTTGSYGVLDFTQLRAPGTYRIEAGGLRTEPFVIGGAEMWDASCWKVLNFIFCQRCGHTVPGVHSQCHTDLFSHHGGQKRSYAGGWHDAGDLSQQTLQTADVADALFELYAAKRESNPALAARLREEALWGLEFVLRNRYGDGFHASSMGLLIWQDGVHDSHDDIHTVRVQDLPFDNFLYAAYEARAAQCLDCDPMLAQYLRRVAAEDYEFALEGFRKHGYGGWINPYEHTYCTSECQFNATASWAASQLYRLTGERRYADDAARYGRYVLDCRQTEPLGEQGLKGFFYRTPEKRSVIHFIHQSREQVMAQALTELCRTQPDHADCAEWHRAIVDYAGYLKALMHYTAPYGMLPSGIYRTDEHEDRDAFFALHLFPPADAAGQFIEQAAHGEPVAPGYFVRRFPVWFNVFNGNLAVHTSMGKAAAVCARYLGDDPLRDIAREQLYWIVGKNPFAQSLIYGEGHRYPSLNNFSSGEMTGAMPVGIRSLGASDVPYWPQINNACYKEVWLTSAGKWMSLVAELV